jgi:hypothetical protein
MNFLNDIWTNLLPVINWVVFIIVIASGYFIRATPILKKCSTTLKVLIFSLVISLSYAVFERLNPGVFIASYFIAFGFHSAILKLIERFFTKSETIKTSARKSRQELIGDRPDDR